MSLQFLHQRGLAGNEGQREGRAEKKFKFCTFPPASPLAKLSENSYKAIPVTGILAR